MTKRYVLWAGFRHQILEIDELLDLAKIAKVIDGEVDHQNIWWVVLSKLKEIE